MRLGSTGMELVSIIIPVYNERATLRVCVERVLSVDLGAELSRAYRGPLTLAHDGLAFEVRPGNVEVMG